MSKLPVLDISRGQTALPSGTVRSKNPSQHAHLLCDALPQWDSITLAALTDEQIAELYFINEQNELPVDPIL